MPQIVLTTEQQAMLFRLITNYQATINTSSTLNAHQVAWLNFVLTTLPQMVQTSGGDRFLQTQLQSQIAQYYRENSGIS